MLARRMFSSLRATMGRSRVPVAKNEPFLQYAPGSAERKALERELARMRSECPEIPCIIGGQRVATGRVQKQVMPTRHAHALCTYHEVTPDATRDAITASLEAKKKWEVCSSLATVFFPVFVVVMLFMHFLLFASHLRANIS